MRPYKRDVYFILFFVYIKSWANQQKITTTITKERNNLNSIINLDVTSQLSLLLTFFFIILCSPYIKWKKKLLKSFRGKYLLIKYYFEIFIDLLAFGRGGKIRKRTAHQQIDNYKHNWVDLALFLLNNFSLIIDASFFSFLFSIFDWFRESEISDGGGSWLRERD